MRSQADNTAGEREVTALAAAGRDVTRPQRTGSDHLNIHRQGCSWRAPWTNIACCYGPQKGIMRRQSGESRIFGPVDPYCVPPVAALAGVAVTLALTGTVGIGIAAALLALLIVMFDSWANRHESAVSHRVERNGHVRREWYERRLG